MYYFWNLGLKRAGIQRDIEPRELHINRETLPQMPTDMVSPTLMVDVAADKLWYEEMPLPPPETPEQQQSHYEALTAQYIHEQYPIDKEQAITRKAIAYPADEAIQAEFAEYNAFAEDCKARARGKVFGA